MGTDFEAITMGWARCFQTEFHLPFEQALLLAVGKIQTEQIMMRLDRILARVETT